MSRSTSASASGASAQSHNNKSNTSTSSTSTSTSSSSWVTPGELLGHTSDYRAGTGTYVLHGSTAIYAGVVGVKSVMKGGGNQNQMDENDNDATDSASLKPLLSITSTKPPTRLPAVGDIVTCRVTRITSRMATVDILVLHPTLAVQPESAANTVQGGAFLSSPASSAKSIVLDETLLGSIRQRDIRAFDIDSVEVYKSYRPGDLVRAQVLSLGDARSYFLSTARNDLGVILAQASGTQNTMIPINWEQMQCTVTGAKEYRKVAKIDA